MNKLNISPDSNGYGLQSPQHFIAHQLRGGNRIRCDIDEQSFALNLKWTLPTSEFATLSAFISANASVPFLIDLLLLEGDTVEYTAILIPDSFRIVENQGDIIVSQANIEVLPDLSAIACQIEFISVQSELGFDEADKTIKQLATFVNVELAVI